MSDEVFPDSVKDFVFDLHDASRRSFISSEEQALYTGTFREITAKVSIMHFFCLWRQNYILVLFSTGNTISIYRYLHAFSTSQM